MELFHANKQWATRPDDEKFKTVEELYNATQAYFQTAGEKVVPLSTIRVEADNGDVKIVGKSNNPATFTHWSFGQICNRVGAPPSYLRELPATLACQNINYGLANYRHTQNEDTNVNLLFHSNGSLLLRAFTSEKYARIWNWEVAERCLNLVNNYGWTPAMPDWNKIDNDNPPLYASDHDMFVFLCNDNYRVQEPNNPDGLKRGTIVVNSEVGSSSLKLLHFLYRGMCGNHIIWGASQVKELKVKHIGNAAERWANYQIQLKEYVESSAQEQEEKIKSAQTVYIGHDKETVLDKLFAQKKIGLSYKALEAGYDAVKPEEDGSPNTVWGVVQGLTRYSQTVPYADERTKVDVAAGKIMEINF